MGIERLNAANAADVNAVADLHFKFLGDSPIVALGDRFVRKFFYTTLVRDAAVVVDLCRADGKVVGFISYTRDPRHFISNAVRRHFFSLCWLMGVSVLLRPVLLKTILQTLRLMTARTEESQAPDPRLGEVISLVALPEYQNHVAPGGKSRLTGRLFETMLAYFRELDYERVLLFVKPENRASNIFCSIMGCQFEKTTFNGAITHRYTYHLKKAEEPAQPAPAAGAPARMVQ